jgi:uncharacterized NAD-dependent epimerase/dehydratase family protein
LLLDALEARGICTEFVGTGQTAWLQGARYGIVLDSLVNDFVTGELEHAVWRAWQETRAHVIILEGQGSLMHPAFPGGLEILAATRPNAVVLQHAPERKEYEGASGYAIHLLEKQIEAVELISEKPVLAVTINHEGLLLSQVSSVCASIAKRIHRPVFDVLYNTADKLAELVISHMRINVL